MPKEGKTISETIRQKWEHGHEPTVSLLLAMRKQTLEEAILDDTLDSLYDLKP